MFQYHSKKFVLSIAVSCFLLTLTLLLLSRGTYDPGDGVQHYLIAKYALTHPLLFLDHWGKPIYTLLCMPFAQFGFTGSNIYNLLCNTATALLIYATANKMGFKNAWVSFLLVFFSPLFFITSFSGLTEPTFALILSGSILLMINSRFAMGALLVSFLPFARTEGFFIIPLFIWYLASQNQWKAIIWCGFATLLYSLIGYFVLHDFFWIIHQNPYKGAYELYGKGPLMHFVAANDRLFGLPLVVLFIVACTALIWRKQKIERAGKLFYLLVVGSFVMYFTLHSVFWWKGLFGSLGLHRVMAAVAPLFSLIALVGFNFIYELLEAHKSRQKVFSGLILLGVIIYPFKQYRPPIKPDTEMQVIFNASRWIKANAVVTEKKVYCMYPMMSMLLEVDVFNSQKYYSTCLLKFKDFSHALLPGDLIIWDSHFGNECGFSPKDIAMLPKVKKLATFTQPAGSIPSFEVVVFTVTK